jgi:ATP-dependent DNA helicase RecG
MTPDDLKCLLDEPEGTGLEVKEARNSFEFDDVARYCVAIANEGGGKIILGATDKRPRNIVGTKAFAEPGRAEASLFALLHNHVPVEEL